MGLRETMEKQGQFLFRFRGYLPFILLLPLFLVALRHSEYFERSFGEKADSLWEVFCISISFAGLAFRSATISFVSRGTSGRNTKTQRADVINTTGFYSITRHPLYFGNFLIILGMLLFIESWSLVLVGIVLFFLYFERVMFAEEEYLRKKFGSEFEDWAEQTPIFFPKFKKWKKPELPFSFKTILRREHSTFFLTVTIFTVLDLAADISSENKLEIEPQWACFFIIGFLIYATLLFLKKKTKILDVKGR